MVVRVVFVAVATPRVHPAHPVRADGAVFALPNGQPRLDLVDEPPTRLERLASVGRARRAHDGGVPHVERADAVDGEHADARHGRRDLSFDTEELRLGHRTVRLVLELRHRATFVVVPHGAHERDDRSGARVRDGGARLFFDESFASDPRHFMRWIDARPGPDKRRELFVKDSTRRHKPHQEVDMKLRGLGLVGAALCGIAMGTTGCGNPEYEDVPLTFVREVDASARPAIVAPGPDPVESVALGRAVHWIEVERCASDEIDCSVRPTFAGQCLFDASYMVWETAMGEAPVCPIDGTVAGGFDDALRGPPAIVGPITFGELPANAGWQELSEPLVDGEVYAISAYVYEACDDMAADCIHTKAVGCRFFTMENGAMVPLEPNAELD